MGVPKKLPVFSVVLLRVYGKVAWALVIPKWLKHSKWHAVDSRYGEQKVSFLICTIDLVSSFVLYSCPFW